MENNGHLTDRAAAAQLDALRADRAALADRAMQPWWYDALLGLFVFAFFASYSVRSAWVPVVALPLFMVGMWLLVVLYRRQTGTWVSGDRPGATRRAFWTWLVLAGVVAVLAGGAEYGLDLRGAMAVGGAVLGVGIALISRWWTRLYVAELRGRL